MIPFNVAPCVGAEKECVLEAMNSQILAGDGSFTHQCHQWFEDRLKCHNALLTPSCTHALEMAALLIDIQPDDEIIMPSYTFVSTANAFVLRGAKIIFVDVCPDTMNMDENLVEAAITDKTKAIVPVHYAGVSCDMDKIMDIANKYDLFVIEDAAQGMMSTYKGRPLGTIGHIGTYSFHATKNYTSGGEGGLLIVNDDRFKLRAEIIREKGTNRSQFFRGMVDKYSWVDRGSSYLPSELQAAYLWGQLQNVDKINQDRLKTWNEYYRLLEPLAEQGHITLPHIPENCQHNAHMFYIKLKDLKERTKFIDCMKENDVLTVFHYVPLHSSEFGLKHTKFNGEDRYTSIDSERLVRLPLWYGLADKDIQYIAQKIYGFFGL